ncbi:Spindle pole body protein Spc97/Spc98 family [Spraguea lophii 42_110]|uniref:Spindle pole body component n=1 Tax=Spraguea lophii (strain 42_110) TaxID=1358809 RepID=S7W601_SPRLO|nr:Spindle pole body protein Spc97/Spc98 family [Spraguea lophii 42_110]
MKDKIYNLAHEYFKQYEKVPSSKFLRYIQSYSSKEEGNNNVDDYLSTFKIKKKLSKIDKKILFVMLKSEELRRERSIIFEEESNKSKNNSGDEINKQNEEEYFEEDNITPMEYIDGNKKIPEINNVYCDTVNFKMLALGQVPPCSSTNKCESELLKYIYESGKLYTKLKTMEIKSTYSLAFNSVLRKKLTDYENAVIEQKNILLVFYIGIQEEIKNLEILNQIALFFKENPINPFSFIKNYYQNYNCSLYLEANNNYSFSKNNFSRKLYVNQKKDYNFNIIDEIIISCSYTINDKINSWIFYNTLDNEFFVTETNNDVEFWNRFSINYSLIPFFLTHKTAEDILYIGKCILLLKHMGYSIIYNTNKGLEQNISNDINIENKNIENDGFSEDIFKFEDNKNNDKIINLNGIDILSINLEKEIENINNYITGIVMRLLIYDYKASEYLDFFKRTFLCSRGDFIEALVFNIKSSFCSRSISTVLDSAIDSSFKRNDISKDLGIYIMDNNSWEYITLFYRVSYPIDIIIGKEIILKLVEVFKFLWRFKRMEKLLLNLKKRNLSTKYYLLIQQFYFYFYYEVIEKYWTDLKYNGVDLLRRNINKNLDKILFCIFQNKDNGRDEINYFLESLEIYCQNCNDSNFDDTTLKDSIKLLYNKIKPIIENTTLQLLKYYI